MKLTIGLFRVSSALVLLGLKVCVAKVGIVTRILAEFARVVVLFVLLKLGCHVALFVLAHLQYFILNDGELT